MLLASDINDNIFSYLLAQELCNCFQACKHWRSSKCSRSTSVLIWFNLYKHLVESPKLTPHCEDFGWRQKVCDLYSFVNDARPFKLTDGRAGIMKESPRLVCRSGHTSSLFYVDGKEFVVFFAGATHFYTFVNSYDILSIENGTSIKTYATAHGDVPTARWLHRACSYQNNTKAIVFGGQVNDGAFSNEVYLFTLVPLSSTSSSASAAGTATSSSNLVLESVLVPPIDGDNRNGPRPRGGHSFVFEKEKNRFIVFGGLTSGDESELCVNDTYELSVQDEVSFSFSEAISPGRLGYYSESMKRSNSRTNTGRLPRNNNNGAGNNHNNNNNNFDSNNSSGSKSDSGPMAVWKKLKCTGAVPTPRWCHGSELLGDKMYVFGGWSYARSMGVGTGSDFLNDLYVLDVSTLVWTQIITTGSGPKPRCQCACFIYRSDTVEDDNFGFDDEEEKEVEKEGKGKGEGKGVGEGVKCSFLENSSNNSLKCNPTSTSSSTSVLNGRNENILSQLLNDTNDEIMNLNLNLNGKNEVVSCNNNGKSSNNGHDQKVESSGYVQLEDIVIAGVDKIDLNSKYCDDNVGSSEFITKSDGIISTNKDSCSLSSTSYSDLNCISEINAIKNNSSTDSNHDHSSSSSSRNRSSVHDSQGSEDRSGPVPGVKIGPLSLSLSKSKSIAKNKDSKGYLIIFGGSSHNQEVPSVNTNFSDLMVDYHDFKILDLDTLVWLPVVCSYPRCRGGIHALVETSRGWLLSGGMQTEGSSDMPRFKNDITYIVPNIGFTTGVKITDQARVLSETRTFEDVRMKNKFMSVKA